MRIRRFRKGQWFRVIVEGVHFFTTADRIRQGVGDHVTTNSGVRQCLEAFERTRSGNDLGAIANGIAGRWACLNVQLDMIEAQ